MRDNIETDGSIHAGHRERMREKLVRHGDRIFATYELLEMLLYYVLPQGDTNPTAKRLLRAFGSIDGVFRASREQLMKVEGVGARVADFLLSLAAVTDLSYIGPTSASLVFDDSETLGAHLADYLDKNTDTNISFALLDNSMRLIAVEKMEGENFGSGAVRPGPFIAAAMRHGATIAAIGYTHRNGLPFPYSGDYETAKLIRDELKKIGVIMLELYIIGGEKVTTVHMQPSFSVSPSPALDRFVKSRRGGNVI